MKRLLIPTFTIGLLLSMAHPSIADHGKNFHCDRMPFLSEPAKEAMTRFSHSNGMRKIISFYAWQWENEEMRRICDASAAGKSADTSCLEGRRDWNAIASKIPDGLKGKSNKELRPLMLKLSEEGHHTTKRTEVVKYCANLGVIDPVFK